MVAVMRVLFVIALLIGPALSAGTVEGRAVSEASPLPGCTVTLSAGSFTRTVVSDAEGRYSFDAIPPGSYTITIELSGFETETRDVTVGGEGTRLDDVEVRIDLTSRDDGTRFRLVRVLVRRSGDAVRPPRVQ